MMTRNDSVKYNPAVALAAYNDERTFLRSSASEDDRQHENWIVGKLIESMHYDETKARQLAVHVKAYESNKFDESKLPANEDNHGDISKLHDKVLNEALLDFMQSNREPRLDNNATIDVQIGGDYMKIPTYAMPVRTAVPQIIHEDGRVKAKVNANFKVRSWE